MNDVYKALEEDDRRAEESQSTNLKIGSRWGWLDGLLDLGDICFPDHGTLQSASMASADSKDNLATPGNTSSSPIASAQANVSAPAKTPTKKVEDPNGVEFQKLVSWTKDVSNRRSAAAQVKAEAEAFAQDQGKKPGQGKADDGNVILLSNLSKQPKSKEDAKGNASSASSPSKKRLFKKGKGSSKGKNTSSATTSKKEESSSSPPKATQPKPKAVAVQQQQQATEERQEANDDWRRVTWRSMVTNKAPNPNASQNRQNSMAPSGVFIPPPPQSVYGSPMNDPRYGIPPGSPQPHHHGQHYYPPHHPPSPYGGPYSPHHPQQYHPQQQYPPQQHYPPSPQQQYPPQHQYEQNYPPQYNPNVNSPASAQYGYSQGQARSPRFAA